MTSSPVSSTCTPPGQTPSARHTAKKPEISARTWSKWRVLRPPGLVKVLPCMGSQAHTTGWPARGRPAAGRAGRSDVRPAPMRLMRVSRPGVRCGSRVRHRRHHLVGGGGRAHLGAERVADAGQEAEVGAVELAGPLADPEQVGGAVVPVAGQGVLPGQGLLVAEDQRLVAGPEVDLVQGRPPTQVDPAGAHEPQGPVDLGRDGLVALALVAGGDELLVPHVDLGQVGEATGGEGPQQVQGRRRLVVGGQQPARVGGAGLERRGVVVDQVAPEDGSSRSADHLGRRATGAWRTARRCGPP